MPAASRNLRGSSYDRRRRRAWLVEQFGVPARASRGKKARKFWICCYHCGRRMRADSRQWEVDRFPVCGHMGGRYVRGNIVPSCPRCNGTRCGRGGCREWPYFTR